MSVNIYGGEAVMRPGLVTGEPEPPLPEPERCRHVLMYGHNDLRRCVHDYGHTGAHRLTDGHEWKTGEA